MVRSGVTRFLASSALLVLGACGGSSNTKQSLVRVDPVAAGDATCANGGSVIKSGIDKNGNGTLDDNEVTSSQEVCNGSSSAGSSKNELVAIDTDVGTNCPDGGTRVETGVDTNGNGVLDPSEVTSTKYICDQLPSGTYYVGSVTISSQADLAAVQAYSVVIGNVTVTPAFSGSLSWPALTQATGYFSIAGADNGTDPTIDVQLPALAQVQDFYVYGHSGIMTLAVDALSAASSIEVGDLSNATSVSFAKVDSQNVQITNNAQLATLTIPALKSLQYLQLSNNSALTALAVPSATAISTVNVQNNNALTTLTFAAATSIDNFNMQQNASLTTFSAPLLATSNNQFSIGNHPVLTSINVPLLTTASDFEIYGNQALTTLTAPLLTNTSYLEIGSNQALSNCVAIQLLAQTAAHGSLHANNIYGNDTSTTCTQAQECGPVAGTGATGTFHVCINSLDWADAETACNATFTNGHLATFDTIADFTSFRTALSTNNFSADAWLGYTDAATEGTWLAPTGVTAGYLPAVTDTAFWASGQPDNSGGIENCAEVFNGDSFANDASCTTNVAFFCRN